MSFFTYTFLAMQCTFDGATKSWYGTWEAEASWGGICMDVRTICSRCAEKDGRHPNQLFPLSIIFCHLSQYSKAVSASSFDSIKALDTIRTTVKSTSNDYAPLHYPTWPDRPVRPSSVIFNVEMES